MLHTGIIDRDINGPAACLQPVNRFFAFIVIADIKGTALRPYLILLQLCYRPVQSSLIAAIKNDAEAAIPRPRASAKPIPRDAPVIRAVLPRTLNKFSTFYPLKNAVPTGHTSQVCALVILIKQ